MNTFLNHSSFIDNRVFEVLSQPISFDQLTHKDVEANINLIKKLKIKLVGIGGLDSSDEVMQLFAKEFCYNYRNVKVGKRIGF